MFGSLKPVRTTVIGGFVFLIPVVFLFVIAAKAFEIMRRLAAPIVEALGLESTLLGIGIVDLLTIGVIVALCYLAGLAARSRFGSWFYRTVDDKLMSIIPQYAFVKSMAPAGTESELESTLKPVMVRLDDSAMIAFVADAPEQGLVTVYVPGAPNPWSGSVLHVDASRVEPLDVPFSEVVHRLRMVGRGSGKLFGPGGIPAR